MKVKTHACTYQRRSKRREVVYTVRLGEHRQAAKRGDPKDRMGVHVYNTQHAIDWIGQD